MNFEWVEAAASTPRPIGDFASEIIWRAPYPAAVLDHAGHLEFANPAFSTGSVGSRILDRRGFLSDPELEAWRQQLLQSGSSPSSGVAAVHSQRARAMVHLWELSMVPGWTAVVFQADAPPQAPTMPSAGLILHELRAPMLGVREALDRLTQRCMGVGPEIMATLTQEARAINRLGTVLSGLADLVQASQLSAAQADLGHLDLGSVAAEVYETFELLAAGTGHQLMVDVPASGPTIRGDRRLLARAVANLVDNALKYSPPPGPVQLSVAVRGSLGVIEVLDHGPGILPSDRERIFKPFVRLQSAREEVPAGSGLGLAVVHRVVGAHGGSLSVESHPETGTIFRMSFLLSPSRDALALTTGSEQR